ncbi:MAG: peroxiredoxin [Thermomicrobiales bacterium]
MQAGDLVPDVTVTIENDRVRLRDFIGERWVVLYFYPKDSSPSCTMEARGFNDLIERFAAAETVVIGVSTDDATSHARFARQEGLRFSLGTDPDGAVAAAFGAANRLVFGIVAKRVTFLIERDGHIARVWDRVNPLTHPQDVLDAVLTLTPACPCCPECARTRFPTREREPYANASLSK